MAKISKLQGMMFIKYGHEVFTAGDNIKLTYLLKASKLKTRSGNPTTLARLAKKGLDKYGR